MDNTRPYNWFCIIERNASVVCLGTQARCQEGGEKVIPKEYEKYEKMVTIACINWSGKWGDKTANLQKMKAKVTEASKIGASIICFPELALSGHECGEEARRDKKPCSMHIETAETIPGPSIGEIARLAKELGVYVILGMPEKDGKDPNVRYITAAIVGPEGVIGRYRKVNLAPAPIWTEPICFSPGNELPVFETRYGPIGIQQCMDFWKAPECSRILYLKGARIIFNLAGSSAGPGKSEFMTQVTGCRAIESQIYTASCNHVGKERTLSYYGHSTIAGTSYPRLNKIFAQGGDTEEIVCATLNFESLHQWDNAMNLKKDINWKLIATEYEKLAGL